MDDIQILRGAPPNRNPNENSWSGRDERFEPLDNILEPREQFTIQQSIFIIIKPWSDAQLFSEAKYQVDWRI